MCNDSAQPRFPQADIDLLSEVGMSLDNRALQGVAALFDKLASHSPFMGEHSNRVSIYAKAVAKNFGLPDTAALAIVQMAKLHDIGKLRIPETILNKKTLSDTEWGLMRRHCEIGASVIMTETGLPHIFREVAAAAILSHHERLDGSGYPFSLSGQSIPTTSRIIAVMDSYDAMTVARPYNNDQKPMTKHQALNRIDELSETFDYDIRVVFGTMMRASSASQPLLRILPLADVSPPGIRHSLS